MSPYIIWCIPLLLLAVTGKLVSSSNSTSGMAETGIDTDSQVTSWPRTRKLESHSGEKVIISGNATILSENGTFKLGFFNANGEARCYLGIWYAFIPRRTYVWVGNREAPLKNLSAAEALITEDGKLGVRDLGGEIVWATENGEVAAEARLLEAGDLVLLGGGGGVVWRSFDHPTDTWLPGMNLSVHQKLTCWKNSGDPAPGNYSLRLKPPEYGEIELVFNGTKSYWSTGKWTGNSFSGVPEMTIRYIYKFYFTNPFTPMASFGYIEVAPDNGMQPPLTKFQLDFSGRLQQYSWSQQVENWNIFWSQPENLCRVYGLCGNLGFCNARMSSPCKCLPNFQPVDHIGWDDEDFSGGCHHDGHAVCESSDGFEEVGAVSFDGGVMEPFSGRSRGFCEKTCLSNCSCVGIYHNVKTNTCQNLYGSLLNLQNSTPGSTTDDILYVRVPREGTTPKTRKKTLIFIGICCSFLAIITFMFIALLLLRSKIKGKEQKEDGVFSATNLRVFSYKELNAATRGFSEKIGHGGFGAVFRGILSDSSLVAVKKLERPGGAEREFRAEVCTIGNIQHVNLVRLRGFCSENPHMLLVYDYMPNGPLSGYLKQDGQNLSWDVRLRVAIGTARGIAYLHEECRDCIIHCDIKPENILLDENFLPKVSDFGLAKLIGRDFSRVLATMRGTWGYVAPEWISGVAITAKADVYSYGMTLLELLGGRRNVAGPPLTGGGGTGEKWFFPPWAAQQVIEGNVAAVVDERLAGAYDAAEAARLGLVAVWCIQDEEAMRPTMGMVVKMLEGVVEVTIPSPPKLLQALVSGESFHGVGTDSGDGVLTSNGCSNDGLQVSGNSADSPNYLSTMA